MARRRLMGYGSEPPPQAEPGKFAPPPPPDGKPPVRLPIMPNMAQPQEPAAPQQQGMPNDEQDLIAQLMQMLSQGQR